MTTELSEKDEDSLKLKKVLEENEIVSKEFKIMVEELETEKKYVEEELKVFQGHLVTHITV